MISMNFRLSGLTAFLSIAILLQSCKKETNVGSGLINNDDLLNSILVDTFTVEAYTEKEDSVFSEALSSRAIGEFNDPEFGITRAQFFSQFLLSAANISFGTNPVIDSVVLSFYVDTVYGNLGQQTTFKAYQLSEPFHSAAYRTNDSLAYSNEIGNTVFTGDTGTVKIKLQDSFGTFLLAADADALKSNTNFAAYLYGITVKAQENSLNSNQGALYVIKPAHTNSKITLYYHNDNASNQTFIFKIPSSARNFTKVVHDYSTTTDLKNQLSDKTLGKSQLYLQWAGTKVVITFPYLSDWAKDKKILIHRAELVLPRKANTDNTYSAPFGTSLTKDSLGILADLPDYKDSYHKGVLSPEAGIYYGGGFDQGEYHFLITRYLQKKINLGENTTKLLLHVASNEPSVGRVILDGADQNNLSRTKLLLYYSIPK